MAIFNSLGSNYNLKYVLKSLFSDSDGANQKLKRFLEGKYNGKAILTYKGREALTLALKILNLPKGSMVAINGFTCVAVFNSIRKAGLEPACIDLEETGGLNFTAKILEKELSKNKKIAVVVIQNTLGYPCDIEGILALCKKHNLILIEDLAHCIGTSYENGKEAGTIGDLTVLSFSQDKIIDSVSGGALIIRDKRYQNKDLALDLRGRVRNTSEVGFKQQFKDKLYPLLTFKIRFLYSLGVGKLYHFILKKLDLLSNVMNEYFYDYHSLPNWHASLALYQFKSLDAQLNHRRKIAKVYVSSLPENIFMFNKEKTKEAVSLSSNLRFPVFINNRSELIQKLKDQGIYVSDIWYTDVAPECPNSVSDSKIILNLPTHINVSEKSALRICESINKWLKIKS